MALKTFRPLTPSARFKALPSFEEITKKKPEKSLVTTRKRTGGRNNQGRLTCRHIGGGHKRKLRLVDFKRRKHGMIADVIAIEESRCLAMGRDDFLEFFARDFRVGLRMGALAVKRASAKA